METLTILFMYMDFHFIGGAEKHSVDGVDIYNVFYSLAANPKSPEFVEIYRGSSPKNPTCWRQRLISGRTVLADPDLIEIIGQQITIQEDIASW